MEPLAPISFQLVSTMIAQEHLVHLGLFAGTLITAYLLVDAPLRWKWAIPSVCFAVALGITIQGVLSGTNS